MALQLDMKLGEARAALVRALRDHWPGIAATLVVAAASLGLWWGLRAHEDAQIERMLELEGLRLQAAATRALETRAQTMLQWARRWETVAAPVESAWAADAERVAAADPLLRGFEWRDPMLEPRWAAPLPARAATGELAPEFESRRRDAAWGVIGREEVWVSPSFLGPDARRQILLAAPLLRDGARSGVLTAVVRVRDLADTVASADVAQGFAIAVREGPYHVYGPLASTDGPEAERWWRFTPVQSGALAWEIEYWPTGELMDEIRSPWPPLVLLLGLFAACAAGVGVRSIQVLRRRLREGAAAVHAA